MGFIVKGSGSAADLFGDLLVFRNLEPVQQGLPGLGDLRQELDIPMNRTPRKLDPDYGRVVARILNAAQAMREPAVPLNELIYIGDTRGSDGAAFQHTFGAGDWRGAICIINETASAPGLEAEPGKDPVAAFGNHWGSVFQFEKLCLEEGFELGSSTAAILDLDKTTLGGRGRNDEVINQARVAAVKASVEKRLGDSFDPERFQSTYQVLNRQAYHPFTGDNQDCIAYLCILLGVGALNLESLLEDVEGGRLNHFTEFLQVVESLKGELPDALAAFHVQFRERFLAGDPTPFKDFRRREYLETIRRMGQDLSGISPNQILAGEIALTGEIYDLATAWQERGVLLFGLSDKPDEASLPTSQQAAAGYEPIHKMAAAIISSE